MKWIPVEGIKLTIPSESRISKDINILTIQYMDQEKISRELPFKEGKGQQIANLFSFSLQSLKNNAHLDKGINTGQYDNYRDSEEELCAALLACHNTLGGNTADGDK